MVIPSIKQSQGSGSRAYHMGGKNPVVVRAGSRSVGPMLSCGSLYTSNYARPNLIPAQIIQFWNIQHLMCNPLIIIIFFPSKFQQVVRID